MSAYADLDDLKLTLEITKSDNDDLLEQSIAAASGAIDRWMDTVYEKAVADAPFVFTASGPMIVEIYDFAEITTVEVDRLGSGTYETWTGYKEEPANAIERGKPIQWLRPPRLKTWPCHAQAIRVTGKTGWPEVPTQVVEAAQLLAEQLWKRKRETPMGIMGLDQASASRVLKEDPHICGLLTDLGRVDLVF